MEEALASKLLADPGLTQFVGQRIYWGERPQAGGLPAIVMHLVDRVPTYSDEGDLGLDQVRVQINCLAADKDSTIRIARQVRRTLQAVALTHGVVFQGVFPESLDRDLPPEEVAGTNVHGRALDYQFWLLR